MPSGISEKEKLGRISRLANTDYSLAWLAWLRAVGAEIVSDGITDAAQEFILSSLRNAFDAGWDARGLADLAIIHKCRKPRDG